VFILREFAIFTWRSDYRRGLDCWLDLLHTYKTLYYSSQITIGHTRSSQSVTVFTSRCLVAATKKQTFPFLWVPELPQFLSYQLLTATAHNEWTATILQLTNSPINSLLKSLSESESYITTDGQSASLSWKKHPSAAYGQIFITVKLLRFCWCGALSLTRGRICSLQSLLDLASAVIFGSEFRGTRDHILLSHFRDFPLRRLLRLAGLRWRYSTPTPHGIKSLISNFCLCHICSAV
jgi:hypothetical protein